MKQTSNPAKLGLISYYNERKHVRCSNLSYATSTWIYHYSLVSWHGLYLRQLDFFYFHRSKRPKRVYPTRLSPFQTFQQISLRESRAVYSRRKIQIHLGLQRCKNIKEQLLERFLSKPWQRATLKKFPINSSTIKISCHVWT